VSNIDWDFILSKEGFKTSGYVPDAENSNSGVTIASGFDLGQKNESDLQGLPDDIVSILKPYLGIKGADASSIASNLKVSEDQAKTINEFAKSKELVGLKDKWQQATGKSFDDLPMNEATVIASVAFQYGDLSSRTPNFWNQVTSGDWDSAVVNLNDFGDRYSTRRRSEAQYYESKKNLK